MLYELGDLDWDLVPGPAIPPSDARVAVVRGRELVSHQAEHWEPPVLADVEDRWPETEPFRHAIPLGRINGRHWYALEWPTDHELPEPWCSVSARDVLVRSESAFAVASRATQMVIWRQQHRYCGQCGRLTEAGEGEHYRFCEPCGLRFYPRINPCIIVLVVHGDQVLLAQGRRHRGSGWYSTLAGFMEPGESAEQAVHREVMEEVGVRLGRLRYLNSQTWPFPHQLMLGFIAEYAGGDIRLQPEEIERARWFSIDDLPAHPPVQSISGWLIRQYLSERGL